MKSILVAALHVLVSTAASVTTVVRAAWVVEPPSRRTTPRGYPPAAMVATTTQLFHSSANNKDDRWSVSGRWEQETQQIGEQFLLKEKFGSYFKVRTYAVLLCRRMHA